MIPPHAPTVHGINSRIVFLTLTDVLCVRCQYIGIHSRNVSFLIITEKILEINNRGDRGDSRINEGEEEAEEAEVYGIIHTKHHSGSKIRFEN